VSRSAPDRPVGAHVPVGGGLVKQGLAYAKAVRAEALQVFTSNPRGWALSPGDPVQDRAFRDACGENSWPVFVHSPYLINLGSPTAATLAKSVDALQHTLERAAAIGAQGVVIHGGSAVVGATKEQALQQLGRYLMPLLDAIPEDGPDLLVEPTAGGGIALCASVDDLGPYLDAVEHHPRVGVCLDTCHAWAAGHDLRADGGIGRTVRRLEKVAGKGRLKLIHANDSRDPLGSSRDRHETLGKGALGPEVFAALATEPRLRGVPIVVETPSEPNGKGHARDVRLLKKHRTAD
jgi:deoxyribonuclease-4